MIMSMPVSIIGRRIGILVASLFFLWTLSCLAASAHAARNASTPLSKAEFDAVVAEARRVAAAQGGILPDQRVPPKWRSLDRGKLARMLQMPEFAALDDDTKAPLIDQAGAWELMPFDSPSEALAMWARWYPHRGIDKPISPYRDDVHRPHVFYADAWWATEAGAMIALFQCLPAAAWYVRHDEPMLWVMEHNTSWDSANAFDFGMCVRKQDEGGGSPFSGSPDTRRGKASAAVLEKKLSAHLLKHGCTGEGPDRCLPLLHALISLNPRHAQLPAIIKLIEPEFGLGDEVRIPDSLLAVCGPDTPRCGWTDLSEEELALDHEIRRTVLRKIFFLTAKIPVLLDNPSSWPDAEFDKTLGVLLKLTASMSRLEWLDRGRTPLALGRTEQHFFADPWRLLRQAGGAQPAVARGLTKWGREYGRETGCGLAKLGLKDVPPQFWFAYAIEKLAHEQTTCEAMPYEWTAQLYAQAMKDGKHQALEPIAELRKYMGDEHPDQVRQEIVEGLGQGCPQTANPSGYDPWGVCSARIAYHDAAEVQQLAGIWHGVIDTRNIVACIDGDGRASYRYEDFGTEIALKKKGGNWQESEQGRVTGYWDMTESEDGALRGEWSDASRKRRLPLRLQRVDIPIPETDTPCASEAYKIYPQVVYTPEAEPEVQVEDTIEAGEYPAESYVIPQAEPELPRLPDAPITMIRPPDKGDWEMAGQRYVSSENWMAMACNDRACELQPASLKVIPTRILETEFHAVAGQRLQWQAAKHSPKSRIIAYLETNPGFAWLKAGPVKTIYGGKGRVTRPSGPGTLEALLNEDAAGEAKLMPVHVRADPESLRLEYRDHGKRQILGHFEIAQDEEGGEIYPDLNPETYLLWAGDLDGDDRPDMLVTFNAQASDGALFLSSLAKERELIGMAASYVPPQQEGAE